MKNKYRWGITGTGMIAHKMAEALTILDNAEITSVLSRKEESAQTFARKYNIKNTFTDLQKFAEADCYDIAYIGTPHPNHVKETIACLENGKAVLCEKPMGVNLREAENMIAVARKNNILLVEAFWTYYFPAMRKTLSLIKEGVIGKPEMVNASFCIMKKVDHKDRKFNPDLAGGALLDIGLYCITLAQMVFEEFPKEISGIPIIGSTGIDESSSYTLRYSDHKLATLRSSFRETSFNDAWIFGEKGKIKIPSFWKPDECTLFTEGIEEKYQFKKLGNGYTYEAIEMMKYLDDNKKESEVFSLEKSRELVIIMDELRKQWGLKYPFET